MWPRKSIYKYYTILAHGGYENMPIHRVPNNIILVLMAECGRGFTQNVKFRNVFKNKEKIIQYLENNTVYKNIHSFNSHPNYENQYIELNRKNNMLHGVYKLPINIRPMTNSAYATPYVVTPLNRQKLDNAISKSIVPVVPGHNPTLSLILQTISKSLKPGRIGVVFGTYCRSILTGTGVVSVNNTSKYALIQNNGISSKVHKVLKQKNLNTVAKSYSRLRTLKRYPERGILKQFKKSINKIPHGQKSIKINKTRPLTIKKGWRKYLKSLFT